MSTDRRNHAGSIVELLRHRARFQAARAAFVFLPDGEGREQTLTYGELDRRVRALAGVLREKCRAGDRVMIMLPPGPGYIAALFACFYARLVAVPTLSPRARRRQEAPAAICRDCSAAAIVTDEASSEHSGGAPVADIAGIPRIHVGSDIWDGEAAFDDLVPGPRACAVLQYTSGSTGQPKGVMVTHGNLLDNLEAAVRRFAIGETSRGVTWLPPYHDMGLVAGTLQPVYSGCITTVMSPLHAMQRPIRWLKAIERSAATISGAPPFGYDRCVATIDERQREQLDLTTWECAFVGAEPIAFGTLERFTAAFARCGFRASAFAPCYGLAEATLMVTGRRRGSGATRHGGAGTHRHRTTCGDAVWGHEVLVVDPERATPCPDGSEGEIWVAGASVAAGYWGRPAETAATFHARLADGRGPYLRTGDLGVMTGGELTVTGRIKDLVITAGRKLHPEDIEATIRAMAGERRWPCVPAVFGIGGEGKERIVVTIERGPGLERACDPAAMRTAVAAAVARAHDVTVYDIVFVPPNELPRTSSGKIRRQACRTQYLASNATARELLH